MNYYIHTIMQDTPVAAVIPKEASRFAVADRPSWDLRHG